MFDFISWYLNNDFVRSIIILTLIFGLLSLMFGLLTALIYFLKN